MHFLAHSLALTALLGSALATRCTTIAEGGSGETWDKSKALGRCPGACGQAQCDTLTTDSPTYEDVRQLLAKQYDADRDRYNFEELYVGSDEGTPPGSGAITRYSWGGASVTK